MTLEYLCAWDTCAQPHLLSDPEVVFVLTMHSKGKGSTARKSWYNMVDFFCFFSWTCHSKGYQVLEHVAERYGGVTIPGHVKKKPWI